MEESEKKFLSPESLSTLLSSKTTILLILIGIILIGFGVIYSKIGTNFTGTKVEILNDTIQTQDTNEITVEISGSVEKPGVYKLSNDSRIEDLIIISGGISVNADRPYIDKYLNRAAKLTDGQKLYIPNMNEQTLGTSAKNSGGDQTISSSILSDSDGLININTASLNQLDKLPGIGQVYGQSIIDHRPYSTTQELVSKGAVKQSVFEKIKNQVTVF